MVQSLSTSLRSGFRFLHFPLPAFYQPSLRSACLCGQRVGLTVFHLSNKKGVGSVCLPMVVCPCNSKEDELSNHLPFWLKPISIFGLSSLTEFINSSPELALPFSLAPFRMMLADLLLPHGFGLLLSEMGYVVPPASYRPVTGAAWGGRLLPRERQVSFWIYPI